MSSDNLCREGMKDDNQCDQIGQFLKVLGHKFTCKCSPIFGDFLFYFERNHLFKKTVAANFWVTIVKFGYFLLNIWSHWLRPRFCTTQKCTSRKAKFWLQNVHLVSVEVRNTYFDNCQNHFLMLSIGSCLLTWSDHLCSCWAHILKLRARAYYCNCVT